MDLHLFRPAIDSKGFFSVNGADVLGGGNVSLGLIIDYGHNLMPLRPGHSTDVMLRHAFSGTFQFDYGIKDFLVIGISAPVVLNGGDSATGIGPTGKTSDDDKLDGQALGNAALHAKFRILSPDEVIGLALLAQVGYGVGATRDFGSDPGLWYWPQAVVEKRFGAAGGFRVGLNVGYRGHTGANPAFGDGADGKSQLQYGDFKYSDLLTGGFGLSLRALNPLDLVVETYATQQVGGGSSAAQKLSAEAMGGIKLFIEKNSFLMLSYGMGYTHGFEAAQHRGVLGFVFEPSADKPKPIPIEEPPRRPKPSDGDRDGDGILDSHDKCPDDPEDKDGFEDEDGCPELDNDKDGIPDMKDACPNEPETFNGFEDEDGCPDKGSILIEGNDIVILDKILFKTGSAEILQSSMSIVAAVATTLTHHPEFTMVEVQGHADERGDDKPNQRLTKERAEAVVSALVQAGVPAAQLRAMGYGEYCPIDPTHNAAAWEKNRRVEFKVVRTQDGPTGVDLGCELAKRKGIESSPP
jgi:outer membrane protein OmpA-like peptidoglycan-associated protein